MIFFLHGPDTFRSRQKLREIKEKFRKDVDPSGMNLSTIDGSKCQLDDINRAVLSAPFLAKRRLVVAEDLFSSKNEEIFDGVLNLVTKLSESASDSDCILVIWDGLAEAPKKSSAGQPLWVALEKQKFNLNFDLLDGSALSGWLGQEFQTRNFKISRSAAEYLVSAVGPDTWQLKNEVSKLAAYADSKGADAITEPMIQLLVTAQVDENIFALVDAVGQGQKGLALKLLDDQIESGANEIYLLTMIVRAFRILALAKLTDASQHTRLGLHAFVLKKALSQSRNYTAESLTKIYGRLLQLDYQIKTGFAKPVLLIDMFVAST